MNFVLSNKAIFLGVLLLVPVALNSMEPKFCPEDITDQPPIKQKVKYAPTMKELDVLMVKAVLLKDAINENEIEQNKKELLEAIQQTRERYLNLGSSSNAVSIVKVPHLKLAYWFDKKNFDQITQKAFALRDQTEGLFPSADSAYTKVGDMAKNEERSPFRYEAFFDNFDELEAVVENETYLIKNTNAIDSAVQKNKCDAKIRAKNNERSWCYF